MMANTKNQVFHVKHLVLGIANFCAKKMNKTFGSISLVLLVKQT